jgi:hypothetical protein
MDAESQRRQHAEILRQKLLKVEVKVVEGGKMVPY